MKAQKTGLQNKICPLLLAAVMGLMATGCQTYQQQNKIITNWQQGNMPAAVAEAKVQTEKNAHNKDTIIWLLERGAVQRAAGQYSDSNVTFDRAQEKIDDYSQKAKVRIGQEAGAMLSNQAELDYEGRAYDGIMLNTYKALNYLALGETEKVRPELTRALQRQQDAVEDNKKRIEKAQAAVEENKDKVAIQKAQNDPKLQSQLSGVTSNLNTVKVYADYVNPFTSYLDGLYFMANAVNKDDLGRAQFSFKQVSSFAPDNEYVKQDLATVDDLLNGKSLLPTSYVIFETGCAPERGQIRVDIPIIISKVSYVGAAFPTLKMQDNYTPSLTVTTSETNTATALVGSMDGVVATDFKNELPVVITKTIAATVIKAVAAYAINDAARQSGGNNVGLGNNLAGLFTQIATAAYQIAVNIADERTWTTLPKEFQVARVVTPADRKIDLTTPNGMKTSVTVGDGTVNVVYVKSINAATPLLVSQFKLK